MNFNQNFITNIREIYGKPGDDWLNNIEVNLARLCRKRNLIFVSVMPNLTYHFVCLVKIISTNETAVLKMALDDKHIVNEVRCLQCFKDGVPRIYWYDKQEHAILMEYLEPGHSLKKLVQNGEDDLATKLICDEIKKLQSNQQCHYKFKHISELANSLYVLDGHVDTHLLSKAKKLFYDLTIDKATDVVLHGDLHHDNILASGNTWKAIDPHGYMGDPAFEVGSIIFNPYDCFPDHLTVNALIERRLYIMIEQLSFDKQRIKAWAFCKTILSVAWTFEDHGKIDKDEFEIAEIIDSIRV